MKPATLLAELEKAVHAFEKPKGKARCGAFARSTGLPCRAPCTDRPCHPKRCRRHGGTAPRTPEALRRQLEGARRGRESQAKAKAAHG